MNPIFKGQAVKGVLVLSDPEKFRRHLIFNEGEVQVIVRKQKDQRSLNQNNYYFGVVVEILSEHLGYFREEMHEILKAMFLSVRILVKEEPVTYSKSTVTLDTAEFEKYLSNIRIWASRDLGCYVPTPNESEAI